MLGELSKTVWEVATVLWPNSRCLSFGGGEGLTGTAPIDPHYGEGGLWLPSIDGSPMALGLDRGP